MRTFFVSRRVTCLFSCCHMVAAGCALLLCVALVLPPQMCAAAASPITNGEKTRIVSEKMVYDSVKQQVHFEGGVHVTRQDIEIWSDKLIMEMEKNEKPSSKENMLGMRGGKLEKIIAEGNVRIRQEGKQGTCGKATYIVNESKIVMEQSPLIVDGENRMRGRIINFFTVTGRSEVIGDVDMQFSTDTVKAPQFSNGNNAAKGE